MAFLPNRFALRTTIWPFLLFALAVRLAFGSLPAPDARFDRGAADVVLCEGHAHLPDAPHRHMLGQTDPMMVLADALAATPIAAAPLLAASVRAVVGAAPWFFPPVRGPPAKHASALHAQGPPFDPAR